MYFLSEQVTNSTVVYNHVAAEIMTPFNSFVIKEPITKLFNWFVVYSCSKPYVHIQAYTYGMFHMSILYGLPVLLHALYGSTADYIHYTKYMSDKAVI